MERARNKHHRSSSMVLWTMVAFLVSQNLLIPVMASVEDQKTYYSPDPHAGTPPTGSHGSSPPHGHGSPPSHGGGSHGSSPPYHGTPTPSHGGSPPSHGTPDPSHGGGGSPPSNCDIPPSGGHHTPTPTPSTPTPSPPTYHDPTPTPSPPTYHDPTPTPSTPTPSPPTYGTPSTPTPVIVSPPVYISPPSTPIDPGTPILPGTPDTPGITFPSPPFAFDPSSPPFTCDYWRTHPGLVWGLLGWWGTVGGAFGVASLPGVGSGSSLSLQQALSNAHTDAFGALYREGTASLLNSMVDKRFPYTTDQVRGSFATAVGSNKAAQAQARLFKLANEGHLKPRA